MNNFVQGFGFGILFWVIVSLFFDYFCKKYNAKKLLKND